MALEHRFLKTLCPQRHRLQVGQRHHFVDNFLRAQDWAIALGTAGPGLSSTDRSTCATELLLFEGELCQLKSRFQASRKCFVVGAAKSSPDGDGLTAGFMQAGVFDESSLGRLQEIRLKPHRFREGPSTGSDDGAE